jgi:dolichyl-diphosphooligosaccharide--protein glycosyltransferase
MSLSVLLIFFLTFYPNIHLAINNARATPYSPDDAWSESLTWLKNNTPEPFGDSDFYYQLYEPPTQGKDYDYPESAYGIMASWDRGHLITRIAHRIPICNPFQQGVWQSARFFTAQYEEPANQIADRLNLKYIVIDSTLATTAFYSLPTWTGSNPDEFFDLYYQLQKGKLVPFRLFSPQYYQSLVVRLYNFNGSDVVAESPIVISYEEKTSREGKPYKEITSLQSFSRYEDADAYVLSKKSKKYKIVSDNPFISPMPLGKLEHYMLVYSSDSSVEELGIGMIPEVKIFEYIR